MPELPDITVYVEALDKRITGEVLQEVRLASAFLLRTAEPPIAAVKGKRVRALRRLGKRMAIGLDDELWLVIHLMIAGRLHWHAPGAAMPGKRGQAAFDFANGTLILTEAGPRRRASLHVVQGQAALRAHDPGGIEPLEADLPAFAAALAGARHTLKRALTDPRIFSGIGNAYSDEILHRAGLSPVAMTTSLAADDMARLHRAVQETLRAWIDRLRAEAGEGFPEKVTAFRPEMAVHGRYKQPCPACGAPVQRIRYASNETNYCPRCQTEGKILADRALSRLLKKDWPRTLEELEARVRPGPG